MPTVTVLMPVYNGEKYIKDAIESILNQTFTDFEFLIIDDGSTDKTPDILKEYAQRDSRIRLERNEQNLQIAATLNKGLSLATAPLIARMDADDISLPERLEKLVAFMIANPDITVCSGAIAFFIHGANAPDEIWMPPTEHEAIRAKLFFESCIYHPVSIYRKEQICVYAEGYDNSMPPAEDYDLWVRLSMNSTVRFANLPEVLCRYRYYGKEEKHTELQKRKANLVREKLLHHINLIPSDKEFVAHLSLSLWSKTLSLSDVWVCKKWLSKLYATATNAESAYNKEALEYELKYRWKILCENNIIASAFGIVYFCSEFADFSFRQVLKFVKFGLKKILKKLYGKPI